MTAIGAGMPEVQRKHVPLPLSEERELTWLLRRLETALPTIEDGTDPACLRKHLAERRKQPTGVPPHDVVIVDDRLQRIDGSFLRVRDYLIGSGAQNRRLVYVHGGGWVLGRPEHFDGQCIELARVTGRSVRSVDYRLAPEHPYPAALDDVVLALRALRVPAASLVGESAGATLAFGASLVLRDAQEQQPGSLALWYPVAEVVPSRDSEHDVSQLDSPLLRSGDLEWFWKHYVSGGPPGPYAMPCLTSDLAGLPPTALVIAGRDLTASACHRLAMRLTGAHVPVLVVDCAGLPHAFTSLDLPVGRHVVELVASWVADQLQAPH